MKRALPVDVFCKVSLPLEIYVLFLNRMDTVEKVAFGRTSKFLNHLAHSETTELSEFPSHKQRDEILLKFPSLTSLDLNNNKIVTDNSLKLLTRLRKLELIQTVGITIDALKHLTNLTKLKLEDNEQITYRSLEYLKHLKDLTLSECFERGDSFCAHHLHRLPSLTSLQLENNMTMRDEDLIKLTNLKSLAIKYDSLITEESVRKLTKLETLSIRENFLITGDCFRELCSITKLDISQVYQHSQVLKPENLTHLTNLQTLKMRGNLPINHLLQKLTRLTYLDITENEHITDDTLTKLVNLSILKLGSHSSVTYSGISKLSNLTELRSEYIYCDYVRSILCLIRESSDSKVKIIDNLYKENFFSSFSTDSTTSSNDEED